MAICGFPDPDPPRSKLFGLKDPDPLLFHTKLRNIFLKWTKKWANSNIISNTMPEKTLKLKISTHTCLILTKIDNFFVHDLLITEGSGSEITDIQFENPDPKVLISNLEHWLPVWGGAHEREIVVAVGELCLQLGVGPAWLPRGLQGAVDLSQQRVLPTFWKEIFS